ncbi:MAG TPA: glycosyltransferase, partial [Planctomycetota bacterium]|nr:glycosyltransferase [Planctomycetota bacterium]
MIQDLDSIERTPEAVPRRVLFFGKRKSRSCCTGALVDALRHHGLEVQWVNCSLMKRWIGSWGMKTAVRFIKQRYRPDLCFVFFHDLPHTLMAEFSREIPTVVWIEEPIRYIDSAQVDYVSSARLVCLSTPALVWAYRSLGVANSTFLMSGFSPRFHKPYTQRTETPTFDRDLVYIGGPGHMGSRPDFLAWLASKHDLEIFGVKESWQPYLQRYPQLRLRGELRPSGYAEVCARSKIVIGINQTHDSRLYFSNRVFLTLACKGFHLMRYVPGMEEVFEDGRHLMWFHEREDCEAHIERMLKDDEGRMRIA